MQAPSSASSRNLTSTAAGGDRLLWVVIGVAVALRILGGQLHSSGGYDFYAEIAQTFVKGGGLCLGSGRMCAQRLPLYPLLLSLTVDHSDLLRQILQAVLGGLAVVATYRYAFELFGRAAGLVAATAAALSPYAVAHDAALQDSALANALIAVALWGLAAWYRSPTRGAALQAGVALALAALTTGRIAFIVIALAGWAVLVAFGDARRRVTSVVLVILPTAVMCSAWLARNFERVGAPVWTTESGESLWAANNEGTMDFLPSRSIDLSVGYAYAHMTAEQRAAFAAVEHDQVAADHLVGSWGRDYIQSHPIETLKRAAIKMAVPVVAYFSPARSMAVQIGFFAVYAPIHALAVFALWRRWRDGATWIALAAMLGFLLTTAIYWAHTSHASVMDTIWFTYAAAALVASRPRANAGATI